MTGTPGKYNAVVILWRNGFRLTTARDQNAPHFPSILGECAYSFEPEKTYRILIEIKGDEIVARLDDEHAVVGKHPILARERDYFALQVDQPSARFEAVSITAAGGELPSWAQRREALEQLQAKRLWLPHDEQEQVRIRETIARDALFRTKAEFRELVVRVKVMKKVAALQFPEVFATVKERRKKIDDERKRLTKESATYKTLRDAINKLELAEEQLLRTLYPALTKLPAAEYHIGLERARRKAVEVTAHQMVTANRDLLLAKMRHRYPQLERTNEELLAEGRAARAKVAETPEFKAATQKIAEAVRAEKDAVTAYAVTLPIVFAEPKSTTIPKK